MRAVLQVSRHQFPLEFGLGLACRQRHKIPKVKMLKGNRPKLDKHEVSIWSSSPLPISRVKFIPELTFYV